MSRFVITTLGSWGDLLPMLAVGSQLRHRGHEVTVAATPAFRARVEAERLRFAAVGPHLDLDDYAHHPEILSAGRGGLTGLRALFREFLLPNLALVSRDLMAACRGADHLLTHPAQLAAPMVAEKKGLPWLTLSVFPGSIPSTSNPPQGVWVPPLPVPLSRALNGAAWSLARRTLREFDGPINDVRRLLGLPPRQDLFLLGGLSPTRTLVLASPRYMPRPPDWPPDVQLSGFCQRDRPAAWTEPVELTRFLDAGPPPVLVTLGASLAIDPKGLFEAAASALGGLGLRGLLLVGREANLRGLEAGNRMAAFAYVPLSSVAARCLAIVHHGGFGTTAAALLSGSPQLVVPRGFDQPFNAGRVVAIGCGRRLAAGRVSPRAIARELGILLRQGRYRRRAAELSEALSGEDGLNQTCDEIERLCAWGKGPSARSTRL